MRARAVQITAERVPVLVAHAISYAGWFVPGQATQPREYTAEAADFIANTF
ncbi:hypothetical protein [Rhodothermus marinus]|uniref:hypothetical protein n=1 Tax=Rhodothermus marinus TaxID=29549 RepID=UPI001FB28B68|nr:hypothetical protein [Rhodothermus marinus]